ncbi:protoglobin domain-containing protein [Chitinophagaceae bacterium LB-8]|uniref:Protoglobin domain-containing protein n=1 Tax=Paraflavisolibacter caeni TaxID=2982496 RepID=A0A9X2XRU0_9BACT|nr:protoglobin domain-containing protein [Paraflavisolibacter caeni]MCU7547684.1 protoglobin domain-containing protein [Paraflavisolibacter caeni]
MTPIKGYAYGESSLEASPITIHDLDLLKKTLLWSDEDDQFLKLAGEVLKDQVNDVLDLWYGYVGGNPHLLYYFTTNGQPNTEYLSAVRERFGQWILDLCQKPYDQDWLNYQHEIALRHYSTKKNKTDGVDSVPIIHLRYLVAFIYPITVTIKSFLAKKGHSQNEVESMYNSWFKAVTLTALLWSYPYVREGGF